MGRGWDRTWLVGTGELGIGARCMPDAPGSALTWHSQPFGVSLARLIVPSLSLLPGENVNPSSSPFEAAAPSPGSGSLLP